jgi:hypothetical protein
MGRILEIKNRLQKTDEKINFLNTGQSNGEEQLTEIYNQTQTYVK